MTPGYSVLLEYVPFSCYFQRGIPGSVQVGLKWKSMKNPKEPAITDLQVPTGSWDIAAQSHIKDAAIFMILCLVSIKKKSSMTS